MFISSGMEKGSLVDVEMVLAIFATQQVRAQFAVIDPVNIVTSISNTATQIAQTSSTAANMLNNFREVQRVYNQGREHFDRLRSVHNLVQDARKVRDAILMVGKISDMFVNNFQLMLNGSIITRFIAKQTCRSP